MTEATQTVKDGKQCTPTKDRKVYLVLQGGGALGAYQVGAVKALTEYGFEPDWVSGISIGALNSAIIVGNPPDTRMAALDTFWQRITWPGSGLLNPPNLAADRMLNWMSFFRAINFGQPNFFTPRLINPWLAQPGTDATSFYDTTPMLDTLAELADFDRINNGPVRLSLGATQVTRGELVFFDSQRTTLTPRHVLASGSLPPGFPAQRIDGELYWDGGCVSNTPLDIMLDEAANEPALVFVIDLWDPVGPEPATMDQVLWRAKKIQYASRTAREIRAVAEKRNLTRLARELTERLGPDEVASLPLDPAQNLECGDLDIVHVVYKPKADQVSNADAEFSRRSLEERHQQGYDDMLLALLSSPWTQHRLNTLASAQVHEFGGGSAKSTAPGLEGIS